MDISGQVQRQRDFFQNGKTKDISFRKAALQQLLTGIQQKESTISEALRKDLNKSEFEAYSSEIGIVYAELRHAMKHLNKWSRPQKVHTPMTHLGARSRLMPEPYGVSLIISPWNYPFMLTLCPLIAAIAAGNCAVIKPSEWSVHTSQVMEDLIQDVFPSEFVTVIQGAVEESVALLAQPFDYVFFTGGTSIGKSVMAACAERLTPVTLELGGKSPCIVHEDANIALAARRIAWGKFLNAGQTCIAPDYLYVHEHVKDAFVEALQKEVTSMFGLDPLAHPDYPHIIHDRHFQRVTGYLNQGTVLFGGRSDAELRILEPTVVTDVFWSDPVMQDEIFGPILPLLTYRDIQDVYDSVQSRPKPLALYLFTASSALQQQCMQTLSFGGGCVNDTLYHIATPYLPFGGVGESGMGAYHGKYGFDTFSHYKSILYQTTKFDIPFRYPGTKNGLRWLKRFLH